MPIVNNCGVGPDDNTVTVNPVVPNPLRDGMNVHFRLPEPATVSIEIYTDDGRLVATTLRNLLFNSGDQHTVVRVPELLPGPYMLRVIADAESSATQFIVAP